MMLWDIYRERVLRHVFATVICIFVKIADQLWSAGSVDHGVCVAHRAVVDDGENEEGIICVCLETIYL